MWWTPEKELTLDSEGYSRLLGVPPTDAETTVTTILRRGIASGRQNNDGTITIWCRRWKVELHERVKARVRDQNYRDRRKADALADEEQTPPSSVAVTVSPSVAVQEPPPTPPGGGGKRRPLKKPDPEGFDDFWNAYPRRVGRKLANDRWLRLVRNGHGTEQLLAAAKHYAEGVGAQAREMTKILHPSTFLNKGLWEDWVEGIPEGERVSTVKSRDHRKANRTEEEYRERPDWYKKKRS